MRADFILILALVSIGIVGCELPDPPQMDPDLYKTPELEVAKDVVIWYTDSAKLKAKIVGKTMRRSVEGPDPYDEFDDGVVVNFYDETGETNSRLHSKYVIRYDRKGKVIARDPNGVILTNETGDSLISSELIWLDKEDKITTEKFVYIRTEDRKIWGQGFESNMEFTKGRIKAVEGELSVDDIGVIPE